MIHTPRISIVMSVYNSEKYLREAIDSILKQTFKDFEFIIINDGSTNGTREILESYNDPRIILIHQENMGLTKSLNKGIARAKGQYIARQDADDISHPERLEKQIDFLERHMNVTLLGTAIEMIDEKGTYLYAVKPPTSDSSVRKGIKQKNYFCHGSIMFRRQSFFELGGYREFFFTTQDYDLWLRFIEKFEARNLPTLLYKHRISSISTSLKNIVYQRRMAIFAVKLADAREKGMNEILLIKKLKNYLGSPLSLTEKKEIFYRYIYWTKWLVRQNKKNEAFSVIEEGVKYHPYKLYKLLFTIIKFFRSTFLLKRLVQISYISLRHI